MNTTPTTTYNLILTRPENGGLIVITSNTAGRIGDVWISDGGECFISGRGAEYARPAALEWINGAGAEKLAALRARQPETAGYLA